MIIKEIKLNNYRNYINETFRLSPGVNLFYGDNAQGKTNALESIYYCASGRSHRGTKDRDIINFNADEAHIKLITDKDGIPHSIDVHLKKNGRKGMAIDGIALKKAAELFGNIHVVFFAPEDLAIMKSSPSVRREFMDVELCQLDRFYTASLINYNKVIIQKNKLLKQIAEDPSLEDTLDIWNSQLVTYAAPVITRRRAFIEEINGLMRKIHGSLTGGREDIRAEYVPHNTEDKLTEDLRRLKEREIRSGISIVGPHRDDISFTIDGIDIRGFGSQGQQRTAALSLKLSEIELVKKRVNDTPVLLLDDVFSELDHGRQKKLIEAISETQTVITSTGLDEEIRTGLKVDRIIYIAHGSAGIGEEHG